MLPKDYRLSKDRDFKRVFKLGKGARYSFLTMRWLKNDLALSRFGFIVSNKISNKAAVRHKIKRRLRESVRSKLKRIKPGYDCALLVSPEIRGKGFREIDEAVEKLLGGVRLLAQNRH